MPNIKAVIEYDGADFHGFQIQASARTVQGELERRLSRLLNAPGMRIAGAGRTDAGVHATGQVVSFRLESGMPADRICPALNGILPADLRMRRTAIVDDAFHARYSAKSRTYIYIITNRERPSVLLARYAWNVMQPLDIEAMRDAASRLAGSHDFASFGAPDHVGGSTRRQMLNVSVWRRKDAVFLRFRANAFLRGMARAITGTLVEVGQGKRSAPDLDDILEAGDRHAAGITAPPQGLYLTRVEY